MDARTAVVLLLGWMAAGCGSSACQSGAGCPCVGCADGPDASVSDGPIGDGALGDGAQDAAHGDLARNLMFGAGVTAGRNLSQPQFVAAGDVYTNGLSGFAVTNFANGHLNIFFEPSAGRSFNPLSPLLGLSAYRTVTLRDLNGDTFPDLIVPNYQAAGTVTTYLNYGVGQFAQAGSYNVGSFPAHVAVGDFDGDGRLDLVVANSSSASVTLLFGNMNGMFLAGSASYPVGASPVYVVVGDLAGKRRSDIAVANYDGVSVTVLSAGTPVDAGIANLTAQTFAAGAFPAGLGMGDFDGDGKMDLVVPNLMAGTISVLRGTGGGAFAVPAPTTVGNLPRAVAVADYDGDGALDVAVALEGDDQVKILLGNGAGGFRRTLTLFTDNQNPDGGAGLGPRGLAAGDFDRDGRIDLVTANFTSGDLTVFWNATPP